MLEDKKWVQYPPIPAKACDVLRVVSVNVNGLRSATKKGFLAWMAQSEGDVFCLQETRISNEQWTQEFVPDGFFAHLFAAQRKGYAGVAIYSRLPCKSIHQGLGFGLCDEEGRFLTAEFDLGAYGLPPLFVSSLYLPSGSSGEAAQARKDAFLVAYQEILKSWRDEQKSLIVCGDYNIVHKKIDIKNWSGNQKSSGCLPHERAWLDHAFDELGFVDSFRVVRQDSELYSWWSNRGQARNNNVGWRIDYHMTSADWGRRAVGAWVYRDAWFSDHAPVVVDYRLT